MPNRDTIPVDRDHRDYIVRKGLRFDVRKDYRGRWEIIPQDDLETFLVGFDRGRYKRRKDARTALDEILGSTKAEIVFTSLSLKDGERVTRNILGMGEQDTYMLSEHLRQRDFSVTFNAGEDLITIQRAVMPKADKTQQKAFQSALDTLMAEVNQKLQDLGERYREEILIPLYIQHQMIYMCNEGFYPDGFTDPIRNIKEAKSYDLHFLVPCMETLNHQVVGNTYFSDFVDDVTGKDLRDKKTS